MARPQPGGNGGPQNGSPPQATPDQLNAPTRKSEDWSDWAIIAKAERNGDGEKRKQSGTNALRPRYYDGTRWKSLHGRHNWK